MNMHIQAQGIQTHVWGRNQGKRDLLKNEEGTAAEVGGTHIVILRRVDLIYQPLDNLLLIEPLGTETQGLYQVPSPCPPTQPSGEGPAHSEDILPQLGPLHTGEQAQQEVHDGRGADVPQQQIHKVILLSQERHELGTEGHVIHRPGPSSMPTPGGEGHTPVLSCG